MPTLERISTERMPAGFACPRMGACGSCGGCPLGEGLRAKTVKSLSPSSSEFFGNNVGSDTGHTRQKFSNTAGFYGRPIPKETGGCRECAGSFLGSCSKHSKAA